jgi:translocation and assembly module TamB
MLTVRGTFPLDLAFHDVTRRIPDEPMDVALESRGASLAILEALTPLVRDASGPLEIAVRLGGRPSAPSYTGLVRVQDGAFRAGRGGVRYTGISGAARFDNDEVVFEDVVVRSPTGDARLEGRVGMRELALGDVQATLLARRFTLLEGDGRTLIVDADLELGGTTLEPSLTGVVNVDQLEWPLPESTDKDVIDLDEAIIYVRAAGDTVPQEPPPDIWRQTVLDLDVSLEDDAFLRSDRALIVMEGDLTIEKPRGQDRPLIAGSLNVVRGFYSDFGAQFEVTEGEIFFYGTPELNPGLHVVANETVDNAATGQEVEVTLTVGGTLEDPTLNVTSVPEYEKSEIFSLLLFGTPYPGPGEEERFESTVTRVATRQAALPLQRALTSELGLDLLEIQPGLGVDGTRVRVGKYIRSNVFVTYSQAVGPREESQLGLQYRLSRSWTVETQAGTRQFGADLFYEFRY